MKTNFLTKTALLTMIFLTGYGCGSDKQIESNSSSIEDSAHISQRPDGTFDVLCKDGTEEVLSKQQISSGDVCNSASPTPSEPQAGTVFDTDYCKGEPLSGDKIKQLVGLADTFEKTVGKSNFYSRARMCYPGNICTNWTSGKSIRNLGSTVNSIKKASVDTSVFNQAEDITLSLNRNIGTVETKLNYHYQPGKVDRKLQIRGGVSTEGVFSFMPNALVTEIGKDHIVFPSFTGRITHHCMWSKSTVKTKAKDLRENDVTIESEIAIFGEIQL